MSDQGQPITFRPGSANDWPSISPWIGNTWSWGDYITAFVWLDWVSSTQPGHLIVAEFEGEIVALCRLLMLGEAEWWLEGVRVAPGHQGRGIGRALIDTMIQRFRRDGVGLLRFVTASSNEAMIAVAHSAGFKHLIAYTEYVAAAASYDYRGFKVLTPANLDLIWAYLRVSPMYRASHFVEIDWTAYYLTRDRLKAYLRSDTTEVLGWRQGGDLAGLSIVFTESGGKAGKDTLRVGYVDAPEDTTLLAILAALQGLAAKRGYARVSWHMPLSVGLERPIANSAYISHWDDSLWLFELPVVAGPHAI
jgi:GNAT superfamily N-acetyltransferase